MFQPKDIEWMIGYKNKIHICAAYKRLTSDIHVDWKYGDGKSYFMQMQTKRKLD